MGFSHVGAAAVLMAATMVSAFQVAGRLFDSEHELSAAARDGGRLDIDAARTTVSITDVTADAGTLTVLVRNMGSTTLDASEVDLLVDGTLEAIASYSVGGVSTDVWSPLTTLQLTAANDLPGSVLVATGNGATAVWRA